MGRKEFLAPSGNPATSPPWSALWEDEGNGWDAHFADVCRCKILDHLEKASQERGPSLQMSRNHRKICREAGWGWRSTRGGTACAKAQWQERAQCAQKTPELELECEESGVCLRRCQRLSRRLRRCRQEQQQASELGGLVVAGGGWWRMGRGGREDHIKAKAGRWGRVSWWIEGGG